MEDHRPETLTAPPRTVSSLQNAAGIALGLTLVTTGTLHLTLARDEFQAQVPPWLPLSPDTVVVQSGIAELSLGLALLLLPRHRTPLGRVAGLFFTAIFPGNIAQYTHHRNAFGLDTDGKRFARLFVQPVLVAWALWSAGRSRHGRRGRLAS